MSNVTAMGGEIQSDASTLLDAAGEGDAARVASLVAAGARADAPLPNGETALMRVASRGFDDVARVLLDAGADVNARRADGFTPLVLAVFFGHEPLVRLLLERGADAGAATRLGTTARQWADARGFKAIAAMLPASRPRAKMIQSKSERASVEEFGAARAEEVSIFSRRPERKGVRAAFERADPDEAAKIFSTLSADALTSTPSAATPALSASTQPGRVSAPEDSDADASDASVSVRRDERLPSHPSASTFRLRNFLRSWQASVGTLMLLLAFGVGVFALWRGSKTAGQNQRPAPTPQNLSPQTVAQPIVPAQNLSAPQASPTPATPDAQGNVTPGEVPGASYVVPVPAAQPYYNPPNSVLTNAPKEPTVISESGGATAGGDSSRPKNRTDSTARETAPPAQTTAGSRDESTDNSHVSEPGRDSRTADAQPARPSAPPPAPTPTPRGKVIQWPPQ